MSMKTLLVVCSAMLAVNVQGVGVDYYMRGGCSSWNSASCFTMDPEGLVPAPNPPGAQDVVFVLDETTVYVSDKTSLAVVNSLSRIRPAGPSAVIEYVVPAGETWTNDCPINYEGETRTTYRGYGKLVKRGAGTLELTSATSRFYNSSYDTDYDTTIDVEEGVLKLPQTAIDNKYYLYCNEIIVGKEGELWPCQGRYTYPCLVSGSGMITHSDSCVVFVLGDSDYLPQSVVIPKSREFSGSIGGKVCMQVGSRLMLTGTTSTTKSTVYPVNNAGALAPGNGTLGVKLFGMAGEPSSLGVNKIVTCGDDVGPGGFLYLGDGETTDKDFRFYWWETNPNFIDAGLKGGIVFTGNWMYPDYNASKTHTYGMQLLQLMGSNVVDACCMRGGVIANVESFFHVVKDGPGIWSFEDSTAVPANFDRLGLGSFSVREGTLRYSSLAPRYELSSLGTSSNRMEAVAGKMSQLSETPWFVALGDGGKEGALEYTGTNAVSAETRPIVFKGNARLRNSGTKKVRYLALPSESAGALTLSLDGDNDDENEISDLTDTELKPMSVVKEGTGKWVIGGDLTFHGTIDVKGGELVIRKYPAKYSWYKWVIKESAVTAAAPEPDYWAQCNIFALYDKTMTRINGGLSFVANAMDLAPGQAAFGTTRRCEEFTKNGVTRVFSRIFLDEWGDYNGGQVRAYDLSRQNLLRQTADNPCSWIPVVMRLPDGVDEAVSWDYVCLHGKDSIASNVSIVKSAIEASVDGLHWDNLTGGDHVLADEEMPANEYCWYAGKTANVVYLDGNAEHHLTSGGKPFDAFPLVKTAPDRAFSVLTSCSGVTISGGASLTADGEGIGLPSLNVDFTAGGGNVSGFTIPDEGYLDVTNLPKSGGDLPLDFAGCSDLRNMAKWTLRVDGKIKTNKRIEVSGDTVKIVPNGLVLIFR